MSPFESWLWHAWLPKVRSAINNEWLPEDPSPAIRLYEAWSKFLPPFIRDNFFDQLVLPKVHKAVADWNPKKQQGPLHTLIFPWLPHVGLRVDEILGEAGRKVKSLMRAWKPADGVPNDILVWGDVSPESATLNKLTACRCLTLRNGRHFFSNMWYPSSGQHFGRNSK
jgi:tuftelin-interacting protein 11